MRFRHIIHGLVGILIISTAFMPLWMLRKGVFAVPFLVSLTWIVFNGCILHSNTPTGQRQNDLYIFFRMLALPISEVKCKYIIYSGMILLPTIMCGRLLYTAV
jgi:hypothetical protein